MSRADYQRLRCVLEAAIERPADRRESFLREACRGDDRLLAEARELLAFDGPAAADGPASLAEVATPWSPEDIGGYRVLASIGEGGMGSVLLVEQAPPLRRRAAMKVIKLGMDTREVLARFDNERQALALMDHPNIARVFDAGATRDGRPFFVMEYVPGEPITDYCERRGLDLRARLELFQPVCHAVQHAHQKGVIHRDLKPSNVLVTDREDVAVPVVIDFGVAKAVDRRLTDASLHTRAGAVIGTPAYMSPEQAGLTGGGVDTRSDIYSLGVLLYELLTGSLPGAGETAGTAPVGPVLDPPRPGDRDRQLRGELDWITMKALEPDRSRRYRTAAELADDIVRYLRDEPVRAGPPGTTYRVRKFAYRHRLGLAVAAVLLLAVAAGIVGITAGLVEARRAEARAQAEARRAQARSLTVQAQQMAATDPTAALAYAIASLELEDRLEVRRLALAQIARGPLRYELTVPGARTPFTADVSGDGRWLATGWTREGDVWLTPVGGGESRRLAGHGPSYVYQVTFGGRSDLFVSAATDSTVRVWSVPGGRPVRTLRLPGESYVYMPQGGDLVVCTRAGGELPVWRRCRLPDGDLQVLGQIGRPRGEAWKPAVDPSGTWIAVFEGREVHVVPLADVSPAAARVVGRHEADVAAVAFGDGGRLLASSDVSGVIRVWEVDASAAPPVREYRVPDVRQSRPPWLRFAGGAERLATTWNDHAVRVFPVRDAACVRPLELLGQSYWVQTATFTAGGAWLVTTAPFGSLAAWPVQPGRYARVIDGPAGAAGPVVFLPGGDGLVTGKPGGGYWRLDLTDGRVHEPRLVGTDATDRAAGEMSVSPDGATVVAVYGSGQTVTLSGNGELREIFPAIESLVNGSPLRFTGDGRLAAGQVCDQNRGTLRLWWPRTGETAEWPEPAGRRIDCARPLDDGTVLTAGDGRLLRWDPEAGTAETVFEGFTGTVLAILAGGDSCLVVRDGRSLAVVAGPDSSGRALRTLPARLARFALSHDESLIAVGLRDGTIEVQTLAGGDPHVLPGHDREWVVGLAFAPGGRFLASAGLDGTLRLWPVPRGETWLTLPRDDLVARLRSFSNLRAVTSDTTATGYTLIPGPFVGWDHGPRW